MDRKLQRIRYQVSGVREPTLSAARPDRLTAWLLRLLRVHDARGSSLPWAPSSTGLRSDSIQATSLIHAVSVGTILGQSLRLSGTKATPTAPIAPRTRSAPVEVVVLRRDPVAAIGLEVDSAPVDAGQRACDSVDLSS